MLARSAAAVGDNDVAQVRRLKTSLSRAARRPPTLRAPRAALSLTTSRLTTPVVSMQHFGRINVRRTGNSLGEHSGSLVYK